MPTPKERGVVTFIVGWQHPASMLVKLPREIVDQILMHCVPLYRGNKNALINLRLVAKAFAEALTPYVFRTCSFGYPCGRGITHAPRDPRSFQRICRWTTCLNFNLSEMRHLTAYDVEYRCTDAYDRQYPLGQVSEVDGQLRIRYDDQRGRADFETVRAAILARRCRITRLRFQCPQVTLQDTRDDYSLDDSLYEVFTRVASSWSCFDLHTLVLDQCDAMRPLLMARPDGGSTPYVKWLRQVRYLVLSQREFTHNVIAVLACRLSELQSLSIHEVVIKDRYQHGKLVPVYHLDRPVPSKLDLTAARSLTGCMHFLPCLQRVELNGLKIHPVELVEFLTHVAPTLEELYLVNVGLEITAAGTQDHTALWIGHHQRLSTPRTPWIAHHLLVHHYAKLRILRTTGLGYVTTMTVIPARLWAQHLDLDEAPYPTSTDARTNARSFDERFVAAATGRNHPYDSAEYQKAFVHADDRTRLLPHGVTNDPTCRLSADEYDALATQHRITNTTSRWRHCIDGLFINRQDGEAGSEAGSNDGNGGGRTENGGTDRTEDAAAGSVVARQVMRMTRQRIKAITEEIGAVVQELDDLAREEVGAARRR